MPQIEKNHQDKADCRFLLITVILVAILAAALFFQTMFSFRPRYEAIRADQLELQQELDQLGRDIDALQSEVNNGDDHQ